MTSPDDIRQFNQQVIDQFRATGGVGELGPVHFDRLVLLTTTGRRSGEKRTVPLGAARDADGHLLLFASNMGAPKHPDWYRNLVADPGVTVEVGPEVYEARAVVTTGDERARLWAAIVAQYPFFADHQAGVSREIPVVALVRRN
jgi:deazaflavin-dependent oxidoreductase (nitroreductase family)